jgi:hypothetical protein
LFVWLCSWGHPSSGPDCSDCSGLKAASGHISVYSRFDQEWHFFPSCTLMSVCVCLSAGNSYRQWCGSIDLSCSYYLGLLPQGGGEDKPILLPRFGGKTYPKKFSAASTSMRIRKHLLAPCTPPLCNSCAKVPNQYGPYAYCSLDKGVACAQHIQLPTHTWVSAWHECTLTSAHVPEGL